MHDIFFFTDIHGMYDLYRAIMNWCQEQDPEAMIIYGGDACDRGHDGYKIMKELLDNPYVVYLMGNHEDMFCKAAREIKEKFGFQNPERNKVKKVLKHTMVFDWHYAAIQDSIANGGLSTLVDWVMDGMPMDLIERVERLPRTFSFGKCDFCHAAGLYETFKKGADAEYDGTKMDEYIADSLIWSRSSLNVGWAPERIAVFGHTPIPYLCEDIGVKWPEDEDVTPILYKRNTIPTETGGKLAMDTGAPFLGITYVLNVLTMKAQGFKDTDIENKEINKHDIEKINVIQF